MKNEMKWSHIIGESDEGTRYFLSEDELFVLKLNADLDRLGEWSACLMPTKIRDRVFGLDPFINYPGGARVQITGGRSAKAFRCKRIFSKSRMEATKSAFQWANSTLSVFQKELFTKNEPYYQSILHKFKESLLGRTNDERSAIARKYFFDHLKTRILGYKIPTKKEEGLFVELMKGDINNRKTLPDYLSVVADNLEAEGADLEPKAVIKSNPENYHKSGQVRQRGLAISDGVLIKKCQNLWNKYYNHPTKKNLDSVFKNLEYMKLAESKKVQSERSRCLKAANKERLKFR